MVVVFSMLDGIESAMIYTICLRNLIGKKSAVRSERCQHHPTRTLRSEELGVTGTF